MQPSNKKIIVAVAYEQKGSVEVAGTKLLLAKQFSGNRRESMPVMAQVIDGNGHLPNGTFILVHHNRFIENSPHHLEDNLYSLAYNQSIFAKLDSEGNALGLCDNILVSHVYDNDSLYIPEHLKKPNKHKFRVINEGFGYEKDQIVFCYVYSDYEIIYVWKGTEKRVIKVIKNDIIGKYIEI